MGVCGDGLRYILLPQEDKGDGQVGSTSRRREAQLCYRLIIIGGIFAFLLLGVTWYKLMHSSRPKENLHNAIQQKLQQETVNQWHDDWQDNKDEDWQWGWESNDYSGTDYFSGSDGDFSGDDYDFDSSSRDNDTGDSDDYDSEEDGDYDYWYRDDYRQHTDNLEDSPAWSLDGVWDEDIKQLTPGDVFESQLMNYKNPCWTESIDLDNPYANNFYTKENRTLTNWFTKLFEKIGQRHWRMRCLPYFYVMDGPEAEAETKDNFYKAFLLHPYVARPPITRPQFWNRKLLENNTSIRDYLDLFDQSAAEIRASHTTLEEGPVKLAHAKIVGEDSGSYLYNMDSWKKLAINVDDATYNENNLDEPAYVTSDLIVTQTPDAKIIIVLRNPVKRLAEYYFRVLNPGATSEQFHEDILQSTSLLNQCSNSRTLRACLYDAELNRKMKVPLRIVMYSVFVVDWITRFDGEDIKFVVYEEYRRFPIKTLNSAYKFLGLGHVAPEQFKALKNRWLESVQDNRTYIWPMLNETRKLLKEFFEPHNLELATIIERPDLTQIWDTALDPDELRSLNRPVAKPKLSRTKKQQPKITPTKMVQLKESQQTRNDVQQNPANGVVDSQSRQEVNENVARVVPTAAIQQQQQAQRTNPPPVDNRESNANLRPSSNIAQADNQAPAPEGAQSQVDVQSPAAGQDQSQVENLNNVKSQALVQDAVPSKVPEAPAIVQNYNQQEPQPQPQQEVAQQQSYQQPQQGVAQQQSYQSQDNSVLEKTSNAEDNYNAANSNNAQKDIRYEGNQQAAQPAYVPPQVPRDQ